MKVPAMSSWSTRNPLGIIALFISLIYGMSALLLGTTVKSLSEQNQTILVVFIVVFPCVILTVFSWLVCKHHTKLYGPGDYRSDDGFLSAGRPVETHEVGKRLREEIAHAEDDTKPSIEGAKTPPSLNMPKELSKTSTPEDKLEAFIFGTSGDWSSQITKAYFAEGLVFQALQSDLRGSIRRDVQLAGLHVDGVVYEPDGTVVIVEVKILSPGSREVSRRLRECRDVLARAAEAFEKEVGARPKPLLAIVVDGNADQATEMRARVRGGKFPFEIRVYSLLELRRRYGFDESSISQE